MASRSDAWRKHLLQLSHRPVAAPRSAAPLVLCERQQHCERKAEVGLAQTA